MNEEADQKAQTLINLVDIQGKLQATRQEVKRLDARVAGLERSNAIEHRQIKNQVKHTFWEFGKLLQGQRAEIEKVNHRVTDSCEDINELQKLAHWILYTVVGLVITTIIAASIKAIWGL